MHDIIIIGAGPAGLSAAIYARRSGKSVLVLEKELFGGRITLSPKVENYPGFIRLSGNELAEKLIEQAVSLGADIELDTVLSVEAGVGGPVVKTEKRSYDCKALIIASGSKHRPLGLAREEEFIGNGVSYCAVCDGAFYKNEAVAVIGGGNTALQDAVLLAEYCSKVTIVQNLERLTGEIRLAKKLEAAANVEIICNATVKALNGTDALKSITINTKDGERELALDGIFVAIGQIPENEPFAKVAALDKYGYIASGEDCLTETDGVFVAGDCRSKRVRQLTTATADGSVAAVAACEYIESLEPNFK